MVTKAVGTPPRRRLTVIIVNIWVLRSGTIKAHLTLDGERIQSTTFYSQDELESWLEKNGVDKIDVRLGFLRSRSLERYLYS